MKNRIIVPANYTFEVIIKVDPSNGQSELHVRNRSSMQIGQLQIAGLLMEHATNVMRTLLTKGHLNVTQVANCTKCGISHAGDCETTPENKVQ
jgi:hypothetical protein